MIAVQFDVTGDSLRILTIALLGLCTGMSLFFVILVMNKFRLKPWHFPQWPSIAQHIVLFGLSFFLLSLAIGVDTGQHFTQGTSTRTSLEFAAAVVSTIAFLRMLQGRGRGVFQKGEI